MKRSNVSCNTKHTEVLLKKVAGVVTIVLILGKIRGIFAQIMEKILEQSGALLFQDPAVYPGAVVEALGKQVQHRAAGP